MDKPKVDTDIDDLVAEYICKLCKCGATFIKYNDFEVHIIECQIKNG